MGSTSELKWALARNAAVAPQPTECQADAYLAASVTQRSMKVEMIPSRETLAGNKSLPGPGSGHLGLLRPKIRASLPYPHPPERDRQCPVNLLQVLLPLPFKTTGKLAHLPLRGNIKSRRRPRELGDPTATWSARPKKPIQFSLQPSHYVCHVAWGSSILCRFCPSY